MKVRNPYLVRKVMKKYNMTYSHALRCIENSKAQFIFQVDKYMGNK